MTHANFSTYAKILWTHSTHAIHAKNSTYAKFFRHSPPMPPTPKFRSMSLFYFEPCQNFMNPRRPLTQATTLPTLPCNLEVSMACFAKEEKIGKSFNEILEGLENEESVKMLSKKRYVIKKVSIVFLFIFISFKFFFLLHSSMNINNNVYPAARGSTHGYGKRKRSCLFKNK